MPLLLFLLLIMFCNPAMAEIQVWPSPRAVTPTAEGRFQYEWVVVNGGVETARGIMLQANLGEDVSLIEASPSPELLLGVPTWPIGDLTPGGSARIMVTLSGLQATAEVYARVGGHGVNVQSPNVISQDDPTLNVFLAPTIDAAADDPEILAFVHRYNGDPESIIQAVRSLRFEPYIGSLRGARGTLWSEAGNSVDRASLLVAALRAAGYPTRYAGATLDDEQVSSLIELALPQPKNWMAPPNSQEILALLQDREYMETLLPPAAIAHVVSLEPEARRDLLFPDPKLDETLQDAVRQHVFVERWLDGVWVPIQLTLPTPPPLAEWTSAELDPALRHEVEIVVSTERLNAFDFGKTRAVETLRHTVASASLGGRPLDLRHSVVSDTQTSILISYTTHTYSPVLRIDNEVVAEGSGTMEVLTNFPLGTVRMVGVLIDVTARSPDGFSHTYTHRAYDLVGASVRNGGPQEAEELLETDPSVPALGAFDATVIEVAPGHIPARASLVAAGRLSAPKPILDQIKRRDPSEPADPVTIANVTKALAASNANLAHAIGTRLFAFGDRMTSNLAKHFVVQAYPERPRFSIISVETSEGGPSPRVDLAYDDVRVLTPQEVGLAAERLLRGARGMALSQLEGASLSGVEQEGASRIDFARVFESATSQGIQIRSINSDNVAVDLHILDLSADVKASIARAIAKGRTVLTPEAPVILDGAPQLLWLEYEPETGDFISVDASGNHTAAVGYILLDKVKSFGMGAFIGSLSGISGTILVTMAKYLEEAFWTGKVPKPSAPDVWECALVSIPVLPGVSAKDLKDMVTPPKPSKTPLTDTILATLSMPSPPLTGTPAFLAGVETGKCISSKVVSEALLGYLYITVGPSDPPFPSHARGAFLTARDPLHIHREIRELASGEIGPSLPHEIPNYALTKGQLRLVWDNHTLEGEGVAVAHPGAWVIQWSDGSLALAPREANLSLENGILAGDGIAHEGVVGLADGVEQFSMEAPSLLEVSRGDALEVNVTVNWSKGGRVGFVAQSPEGWSVQWTDAGPLRVLPKPGIPPGDYEIILWATPVSEPALTVGKKISIRLTDENPSLSVGLAHMPLQTIPADGVPTELVLRGVITLKSPHSEAVQLSVSAPENFETRLGTSVLNLDGGESEEVWLSLIPPETLPAPGTPLELTLNAEAGSLLGSNTVALEMPHVTGANLRFEPSIMYALPGEPSSVMLHVTGLGNSEGSPSVVVESAHLSLEGLQATMPLQPGIEQTLPLTFTLDEAAHPRLPYGLRVVLMNGQIPVGNASLTVHKLTPENALAMRVSELAVSLDEDDLGASLIAVGGQLDRIQILCSPSELDKLLTVVNGILADLSDEVMSDLRTEFQLISDQLQPRDCESFDIHSILTAIGNIENRLIALRNHDFALNLQASTSLLQTDETLDMNLSVHAIGSDPTRLNLTIEGLQGEVASPLVIGSGVASHLVQIGPFEQGPHQGRLVAQAVEAPEIRRSVPISVMVIDDFVSIAAVGADPPFTIPGALLSPYAMIFNQANVPQTLMLSLRVLTPDGELLYEGDAPNDFELPARPGLHQAPLGVIPTLIDGEPVLPGVYHLIATARDPESGDQIPGGVGEGDVWIGLPVDTHVKVQPSTLPPGDAQPILQISAHRPPLDLLPGVGHPTSIRQYVSDAPGPSSVVVDAQDRIFYANFGTTPNSGDTGFVPGNTIGRIDDVGTSAHFATVPESPSVMQMGPDGNIYVANVGNPERVTKVNPDTGETSIYWDFEVNKCGTNGPGENPIGMAFGEDGTLYVSEFYDPFFFGIVYPGKHIYAISPDSDGDGQADACTNLVSSGLKWASKMIYDNRSGDLIEHDGGRENEPNRILRVSTADGSIEVLRNQLHSSGFHFDDDYNLFFLSDDRLKVIPTEVVEGKTRLVGDPIDVVIGLSQPLELGRTTQGDFVTAAFYDGMILQIAMESLGIVPAVNMALSHRAENSVLQNSAVPEGAWADGVISWLTEIAPEENVSTWSVTHALTGLLPGQMVNLDHGTSIEVGETTYEIAPTIVPVDHLIGVSPARPNLRTGTPQLVTVSLLNPLSEETVYTLGIEGLDPLIFAEMPHEVTLAAQSETEVTLELIPAAFAELRSSSFILTVRGTQGQSDQAVLEVDIIGRGVAIRVDPQFQEVRAGSSANFTITLDKQDYSCRAGQIRSSGFGVLGNSELMILADWYRQPDVLVKNASRLINAPAGDYTVTFRLDELIGCWGEGDFKTTIRVVAEDRIEARVDPPLIEALANDRVTQTLMIRNTGVKPRTFTVTTCCANSFYEPIFDSGPYLLGPGEERRVQVEVNAQPSVREYSIKEGTKIIASASGEIRTISTDLTATLISPTVTAVDGEAAFTLRVVWSGDPSTGHIIVDGPVALNVDPIDFSLRGSSNVPIVISGLNSFGPGPWPVRFSVWTDAEPDHIREVIGYINNPITGLSATLDPEGLTVVEGEPIELYLRLLNRDFTTSRLVTIEGSSEPLGPVIFVDQSVSLTPGGESYSLVTINANRGTYTINLRAVEGEDESTATMTLNVLAQVPTPRIESVDAEGAEEGRPFTLSLNLAPEEGLLNPLTYEVDLDDDGDFELEQVGNPEFTDLLFADNGLWPISARVSDLEGRQSLFTAELLILNVPPRIEGEPAQEIEEGFQYIFEPMVLDPGDDQITLSFEHAPEGAVIQEGVVTWTPTAAHAEVGETDFMLLATDDDGGEGRFEWTVIVLPRDTDRDDDGREDDFDIDPTNPYLCADTDQDGCEDCLTGSFNPNADGVDSDFDGLCDLGDLDDDNDGVVDIDDSDPLNPSLCRDLDEDGCDDCALESAPPNQANDGIDFDGDGLCDDGDPDDDNDGRSDDEDLDPLNPYRCADTDTDNCDDCVNGNFSPSDDGIDFDGDGLCDDGDPDDDNDGRIDTEDSHPLNPYRCSDTDEDGCEDCLRGQYDPNADGDDFDSDGICDLQDIDQDGVLNVVDNCPDQANADQDDLDEDDVGDLCDTDIDGDNVPNEEDNCPRVANSDQDNLDDDDQGDLCDDDLDGDTVNNGLDNCPHVPNQDQRDTDLDMMGDLCDDDIDGDSVNNLIDNCPLVENQAQEDLDQNGIGDACSQDIDGDGVDNDEDNCPDFMNATQEDLDSDGSGDLCDSDLDGDEVPNEMDNCPSVANPEQEDRNEDLIGDLCQDDFDHDGVINEEDNCLEIPNPDQADYDRDGMGDRCDDDDDGDGLKDIKEIELGTDPLSPDSDGDMIYDGDELNEGEIAVDTDMDGVIDALDTDSDGDGISNYFEAGDEDLNSPPVDTDGDSIPDFRDQDSDNDQYWDRDEFGSGDEPADTNGDGIYDFRDPQTFGPLNSQWIIQGGSGCSSHHVSSKNQNALLMLILLLGLFGRRGKLTRFR